MIHVSRVDKPEAFDQKVRIPGNKWLREHPDAKPLAYYWNTRKLKPGDKNSTCRQLLADGFQNRCAYCAMYIPVGTVDHFVSFHEDRSQAYEWSNYRFCEGSINASKGKMRAALLLDPYEVQDGWFEILLPSLQLRVSDQIPDAFRERATCTLKQLHLCDDERVLRQRREWYRMYQDGELNLEGLRKKAPLIAAAVTKAEAESEAEVMGGGATIS